jgi:hypothetical protein
MLRDAAARRGELTATEGNHLGNWAPVTEEDRRAVREQLNRMLDSPLFRNSKRYPNLLRYLVEETLAGNEGELKERVLGMLVFHRSPDYDTNQDTVVRLTAGEVRKRIAQYYHQPEHAGQLQIDLVPGSYVPIFRLAEPQLQSGDRQDVDPAIETAQAENGAVLPAGSLVIGTDSADEGGRHVPPSTPVPDRVSQTANAESGAEAGIHRTRLLSRRARWSVAGAILLAVSSAGIFWVHSSQIAHQADHQLWAPILEESGQVHLVVSDLSDTVSRSEAAEIKQGSGVFDVLRMGEMVNYRDSVAQNNIVAFLARHNKTFSLELSTQASYPDLQKSASVLIGGLDNVWTMRLTDPLRYHFIRYGSSFSFGIVDRQHPEQGGWNEDLTRPTDRVTEDYALVARIFDQTTGRPVLVVAGLGANGTTAAAQFLLDPARMAELTAHAPRDWQRLNMEAVLRTQILDNHAGPPRLVACTFW